MKPGGHDRKLNYCDIIQESQCLYVKEKMVVKHQLFPLEFQGKYR